MHRYCTSLGSLTSTTRGNQVMAYRSDSRSRVDYYRGRRRDDYRRPQSARAHTPSESSDNSYYDGDDDDDYRSRYSSRTRRSSYYEPPPPRPSSDANSGSRVINKTTLAVGALTIIAGVLQMWTVKKSHKQREAARKERERDFRKRKEERRRMEAKRDQERQARWAAERERERDEAASEIRSSVRQIEYQPRGGRQRDRTRVRRLPPPSDWVRPDGEVADDGYGSEEDERRSRGGSRAGDSKGSRPRSAISIRSAVALQKDSNQSSTNPPASGRQRSSLRPPPSKEQLFTLALLITFLSTAAAWGEEHQIYVFGGCSFERPPGGQGWNNCPLTGKIPAARSPIAWSAAT
ncbi:hypothetical protein Tdes44962_MAKER08353 [Teratosphaeria destructans]|uniref:Uncharacterized protein n=1 Tax=Teratosphaeria destructans TaxID=418781 RepID=A0A9W7SWT7_9PEZI|nr:hypothetical protein Tdes44962_MAKER08353 [Teratosphaeria destructans]